MHAKALSQPEGHITPTRLQSWLYCGMQYKFQYIDELPETPRVANTQGTIGHRLLEYEGDLWAPPIQPLKGADLKTWATNFDEIFWTAIWEAKQDGLDTTAEQEQEMHTFLSETIYSFKKQAELRRMEIVHREVKLEYPFKGRIITGTLDALVTFPDTPEGYVSIIDYKTGKRKPVDAKLDRNIQMGLYYLAARHNGYKVHRNFYIHLRDFQPYKKAYKGKLAGELRGPGFIPVHIKDEDIQTIYELAAPIVDAIDAGIFPANAYGDACVTCQFTSECPKFQIGAAVQEEWSV